MEFFENLKDCLQAVQSPNEMIRKNGEQEIRNFRDLDTMKFIATLTREIANADISSQSRQMACIIFKNFILNRSGDPKYNDYWINMDPQIKEQIKQAILMTLASEDFALRQQVANTVASIASIEIPRNEWAELLPNLCNNAENNTDYVRLASLTTLGYICEEIDTENIPDQVKNSIIVALVNNISNQDNEACRLAIKAFLFSLPCAAQNFKVQNERDFIMDRLFQACDAPNEEINEFAMMCLRDLSTQEYDYLHLYFQTICEKTSQGAKNPSPKVGSQAYEFWTTLIQDETERIEKNV